MAIKAGAADDGRSLAATLVNVGLLGRQGTATTPPPSACSPRRRSATSPSATGELASRSC
ncbi:MAG: hypothetical protein U0470_13220 [Anaerolineae bacterium]